MRARKIDTDRESWTRSALALKMQLTKALGSLFSSQHITMGLRWICPSSLVTDAGHPGMHDKD